MPANNSKVAPIRRIRRRIALTQRRNDESALMQGNEAGNTDAVATTAPSIHTVSPPRRVIEASRSRPARGLPRRMPQHHTHPSVTTTISPSSLSTSTTSSSTQVSQQNPTVALRSRTRRLPAITRRSASTSTFMPNSTNSLNTPSTTRRGNASSPPPPTNVVPPSTNSPLQVAAAASQNATATSNTGSPASTNNSRIIVLSPNNVPRQNPSPTVNRFGMTTTPTASLVHRLPTTTTTTTRTMMPALYISDSSSDEDDIEEIFSRLQEEEDDDLSVEEDIDDDDSDLIDDDEDAMERLARQRLLQHQHLRGQYEFVRTMVQQLLGGPHAAMGGAGGVNPALLALSLTDRDFTEADYELLLSLDENNPHKTVDKAQIQNLEKKQLSAQEAKEELRCSICLEDYSMGDEVTVLPSCHHCYHPQCITEWLEKFSNDCPVCKKTITEVPPRPSTSTGPVKRKRTVVNLVDDSDDEQQVGFQRKKQRRE